MLRLHSPPRYCENRPESITELSQGFDHIRLRLGIRAPPARLYLNQAPSWTFPPKDARSREYPAGRLGWRDSLQCTSELLKPLIFVCGGSGSLRYTATNKRPIPDFLKSFGGWANIRHATIGGGRPKDWAYALGQFREEMKHELRWDDTLGRYMFPTSWKLIVLDDANELQPGGLNAAYLGFQAEQSWAYELLGLEGRHWAAAMYVYPDCAETFQMDARLNTDARTIGTHFRQKWDWHTVSGRDFWTSIEPFAVSMWGRPHERDPWHHGEDGEEQRLLYLFHNFLLDIVYFLHCNTYKGWMQIMERGGPKKQLTKPLPLRTRRPLYPRST